MVIGMYPASLDILACKGLISVFGLLYLLPEHTIFAQIQKNLMPKQSPNRFIRTGLYGHLIGFQGHGRSSGWISI